MDGILPLWKPAGMTSHDCVMRVRRLFHTKKVGHTGTLDPDAEGVLPLCIGKATKLVPYMTDTEKIYVATVALGTATETEDASGQVVNEQPVADMPDEDTIRRVLQSMIGDIVQVPPMYSAVRVNGKHLYEYARENETVERPVRTVSIKALEQISTVNVTDQTFQIKAVCSKGTYIRTLCVDIGQKLGYPAHLAHLVRLKTSLISENETVSFHDIEKAVNQDSLLLDMELGIRNLDRLQVDQATRKKVLQGQKLSTPNEPLSTNPFGVLCDRELLAIYEHHPANEREIKPVRVFN